jgi:hypothetical protein
LNLLTLLADRRRQQYLFGAFMPRSTRSAPNSEMALAPALVIVLGLVSLFGVGGYWLMKPTVLKNPGVAVYQPPAAAKVLDTGSEARAIAAEQAATASADKENRKLGLAANASANPKSGDSRPAATAAAPKQTTTQTTAQSQARVQKRPDAHDQPRVAQRAPQPFFGLFRLF